jgi:Zn-dependent protease with chaperone function
VDLSQVATLGVGALSNAHGRERERQADRVGLFYMVEAGYDPREAATIWRRLAEATKPANGVASVLDAADTFLFSSHPAARERARNLHREIAAGYATTDFSRLKTAAPEYQRAMAGLR